MANYCTCGGHFGSWAHLFGFCEKRDNYPDNWISSILYSSLVCSFPLELDYNFWLLDMANMGRVQTL